jgi:hypothetical protein
MSLFLTISAALAWLFGAALIAVPEQFYQPTGIAMTPLLATVAQAHGATLIGLGVINWLARDADPKGLVAVLGGNLVVQILSFAVIVRTMLLGPGLAVAPGILTHIVLGSFFTYFLLRARKA